MLLLIRRRGGEGIGAKVFEFLSCHFLCAPHEHVLSKSYSLHMLLFMLLLLAKVRLFVWQLDKVYDSDDAETTTYKI